MDRLKLQKLYGRLRGLKDLIFSNEYLHPSIVSDYNAIVQEIESLLDENFDTFIVKNYRYTYGKDRVLSDCIKEKLLQFVPFLEYGYKVSDSIIEIGSLYNSIEDEELKNRCSDILSAPSNFDRVINQATLVLEDRIRKKSQSERALVGVKLINKVLNTDKSKSVLIASENDEEHEGFCHICRGIMLAFRNPTHHYLSDSFKREDALKFTAFIDNLLKIVNGCKISNQS